MQRRVSKTADVREAGDDEGWLEPDASLKFDEEAELGTSDGTCRETDKRSRRSWDVPSVSCERRSELWTYVDRGFATQKKLTLEVQ
jgi:hypothetical protein